MPLNPISCFKPWMTKGFFLLCLPVLMSLVACQKNQKMTLSAGLPGSLVDKSAHIMADMLNQREWKIEANSGGIHGIDQNLENILEGNSDFAFIMNEAVLNEQNLRVRTVAPLYPLLAMVMYRAEGEIRSLDDLLLGRKIMEIESDFYTGFFESAGYDIDSLDFSIMRDRNVKILMQRIEQENVEVLCVFASIYGPAIEKIDPNGLEIFQHRGH